MRVIMDGAGRIVIPKSVRDGLGLQAGSEMNLDVVDDHLELSVAPVPMRLERRDGRMIVIPERDVPPLTSEMVRELLERGRR